MSLEKLEISKYSAIFVYFQAAVSALLPLLPVSVLYIFGKNKNEILRNIFRLISFEILLNSFFYDMPATQKLPHIQKKVVF